MGRSPAREGRAVSLSKTWNVAKLCSKISSSWRMSSRFSAALRVIESSDGAGLAIDAPLASDNDNPAAPKTGKAFLARFACEASFARDMYNSPEFYFD
jgi:hypothetical protein